MLLRVAQPPPAVLAACPPNGQVASMGMAPPIHKQASNPHTRLVVTLSEAEGSFGGKFAPGGGLHGRYNKSTEAQRHRERAAQPQPRTAGLHAVTHTHKKGSSAIRRQPPLLAPKGLNSNSRGRTCPPVALAKEEAPGNRVPKAMSPEGAKVVLAFVSVALSGLTFDRVTLPPAGAGGYCGLGPSALKDNPHDEPSGGGATRPVKQIHRGAEAQRKRETTPAEDGGATRGDAYA
jgi:hypothetical protein